MQTRLRALVYAGEGDDIVTAVGSRVYGGDGSDELRGRRLYGGRGRDPLRGVSVGGTSVMFGGPGEDDLYSPGRLYGGPGADYLQEFDRPRTADMLVGGPGQDVVYLDDDRRGDVVRVRGGGGVDHVHCPAHPDPDDALFFVDRTDRLSPSCEEATVLYTKRPRYPYPEPGPSKRAMFL